MHFDFIVINEILIIVCGETSIQAKKPRITY